MTLIAGVKGDEFYITMNCGAQAEAKKQGVDARLPGPRPVRRHAADADRQRRHRQEARRDPDRADRHQGDVRPDQAGGRRRHQDRPRRHHARAAPIMAVSQIASDNVGGGEAAAKALAEQIGGSGKVFVNNVKPGISTTDQRAQGFEEEAKKLGLDYVGHGVQPGPARQGGRDHQGAARQEPGPEGHLRDEPVRGRGRRGRPARVRQARTSRSSASTPARSRSRTSRTARSRRSSPRSPPTSARRASSRPSPRSRASRPRRRSPPAPRSSPRTTWPRTRTRSTSPAADRATRR